MEKGMHVIPIIDTHQHLMFKDRFSYEWTEGEPALKGADFPLENYQALVGEAQIVGSIFMETAVDKSFYQEEAGFISELCDDPSNDLLGVVAAAYPEDEDGFEAWLEQSSQNPNIVGYRRVLHVVDDEMSQTENFRKNVRKFGAKNKTFDLCFREDQLDIAFDFASACDNTQLILDHCGVPDIDGDERHAWREKMGQLANLDHVAVKISGVAAYCSRGQDIASAVTPYIEDSIELFGWDRCVWGSDWPVVNTGADLPTWLDITRQIFDKESVANQRKLFQGNAKRIYGIK
jgi:predicted TIM-barrel fold metal-dependent hydrolase